MRFFIDTANVEDIKKANDMGVICGVTTNPSLIAKEGRDFKEVIAEIASIVDGPISGEVKATTTDAEGMIAEGREIAKIHPNMVVKIPGKKLSTAKLKPLRYLKYAVLVVFVILLPAFVTNSLGMGDPFFCKYICPQGVLEGALPLALANSGIRAALGHLFTFKFTILVLFIVLSVLFYRPFCKWICPLGAIYSLFNRVSFLKIQVDHEKCIGCRKCIRACKMDVKVTETPNHPECIRCGECMKACPTDAICYHYGFSNKKKADNK